MKILSFFLVILFLAPSLLHAQAPATASVTTVVSPQVERPEFKQYFDAFHVHGAFVMFNLKESSYTFYNRPRCDSGFIPASTYKIINSLIALESGAIPNEHYVMKWDGVKRAIPSWNHDQDMKEAIRNSTVWYYQEIARRVGRERMQHFVDTVGYGNRDISGPIDSFWLNGKLRISPMQEIEFVQRLYFSRLPFSERVMGIVRSIIPTDTGSNYRLHWKTGWGDQPGLNIGWLVGYLEENGNVYFYATNIESPAPGDDFPKARLEITKNIFHALGLMEGE